MGYKHDKTHTKWTRNETIEKTGDLTPVFYLTSYWYKPDKVKQDR